MRSGLLKIHNMVAWLANCYFWKLLYTVKNPRYTRQSKVRLGGKGVENKNDVWAKGIG